MNNSQQAKSKKTPFLTKQLKLPRAKVKKTKKQTTITFLKKGGKDSKCLNIKSKESLHAKDIKNPNQLPAISPEVLGSHKGALQETSTNTSLGSESEDQDHTRSIRSPSPYLHNPLFPYTPSLRLGMMVQDYLIPTEEEELYVVEEEMEDAEDFVPRPQIHDVQTTLISSLQVRKFLGNLLELWHGSLEPDSSSQNNHGNPNIIDIKISFWEVIILLQLAIFVGGSSSSSLSAPSTAEGRNHLRLYPSNIKEQFSIF
ncbi:hypothetical protein Tco_0614998 [Tanacetum coccineum]